MGLLRRLANQWRQGRLTDEIDEELAGHLEDAIEAGRDPDEARRALGSSMRLRDESRDAQLVVWIDTLTTDVRLTLRRLVRAPMLVVSIMVSLGLAFAGLTTTVRLIDGLVLRPLPVASPSELRVVSYHAQIADWPETWNRGSYPSLVELRSKLPPGVRVAGSSSSRRWPTTIVGPSERQPGVSSAENSEAGTSATANVQLVSGEYFSLLGARPALGRLLGASDDQQPMGNRVAVLSEAFWTDHFAGAESAVGSLLEINDALYEVVGVVAGTFAGLEAGSKAQVFVPATTAPRAGNESWNWLISVFRIPSEVSVELVRERVADHWRDFERRRWANVPGFSTEWIENYLVNTEVRLSSLGAGVSDVRETYQGALQVLLGLAALVVLIACSNVANLLTERAIARRRELALRVSIGAGALRLARLVMLEALALVTVAVVFGCWVSAWATPYAIGLLGRGRSVELDLSWGPRTIAFQCVAALVLALLCSALPTRRAISTRPFSSLRTGAEPAGRQSAMRLLVAVQIAIGFVVLQSAGLLLSSLNQLQERDLGFQTERIHTVEVRADPPQPYQRWEAVLTRLANLPGVESAALADWPLLMGWSTSHKVTLRGQPVSEQLTEFLCVSPSWFEVMGVEFVAGSTFSAGATARSEAVVNQVFAQRYFASRPAVGELFGVASDREDRPRTRIVGVVKPVLQNDLRETGVAAAYIPCASSAAPEEQDISRLAAILATTSSTPPTRALLQSAVGSEPGFRVSSSASQAEIVARQSTRERLLAVLGSSLAGVAVALAGVGLFGVLHYSVRQRRREFSIRMALGANQVTVGQQVLEGIALTAVVGIGVGVVLSFVAGRSIDRYLFGLSASDPLSYVWPVLGILGLVFAASVAPVYRALSTEPSLILRSE